MDIPMTTEEHRQLTSRCRRAARIAHEERHSLTALALSVYDGDTVTDPETFHRKWLAHRSIDGWMLGDVFSQREKTDPRMVAFVDLPDAVKGAFVTHYAAIRSALGMQAVSDPFEGRKA